MCLVDFSSPYIFVTSPLVHIHQKEKFALEIAVTGLYAIFENIYSNYKEDTYQLLNVFYTLLIQKIENFNLSRFFNSSLVSKCCRIFEATFG
jgi:hypothetical protein